MAKFMTEREVDMAIDFAQKSMGFSCPEGLSLDHYLLITDLSDDEDDVCTLTYVYIRDSALDDIACIVPMCIYHEAKEKSCILD